MRWSNGSRGAAKLQARSAASLLALGAILGVMAFEVVSCVSEAHAEPQRVTFETQRERTYWDALVSCRGEVEELSRRLEGERAKVATASVTVTLSCPQIPPCPSAESQQSCLTGELAGGAIGFGGGFVLGAAACAAFKSSGPDVVIAR